MGHAMNDILVFASHGLPDDGQARRLRADVPPAEWQWISRLRRPEDRWRSLTGRALARRLLAERLGLAPAAVPLVKGANDKPVLAAVGNDPAAGPIAHWHFNIAHSGAEVLVAIGPNPLGVDVEQCPSTVDERLRQYVVGRQAGEAGSSPQDFCAEWVCREAILKACGLGLALEPGRLQLAAADDAGWRAAGGAPAVEGWRVRLLWQSPDHCAALCLSAADQTAWQLRRMNLDQWLESPSPCG